MSAKRSSVQSVGFVVAANVPTELIAAVRWSGWVGMQPQGLLLELAADCRNHKLCMEYERGQARDIDRA